MEHHESPLLHFRQHVAQLPSQAFLTNQLSSSMFFLTNQLSSSIFFCIQCLMVSPSLITLFLHELTNSEEPVFKVYCCLCTRIVENTTIVNHTTSSHTFRGVRGGAAPLYACPPLRGWGGHPWGRQFWYYICLHFPSLGQTQWRVPYLGGVVVLLPPPESSRRGTAPLENTKLKGNYV